MMETLGKKINTCASRDNQTHGSLSIGIWFVSLTNGCDEVQIHFKDKNTLTMGHVPLSTQIRKPVYPGSL